MPALALARLRQLARYGILQARQALQAERTAVEYLNTEEIAAKLRVDVSTVRRMIRAGAIRSVKIGRQYRVEHTALAEYVASQEVPRAIVAEKSSLALAR